MNNGTAIVIRKETKYPNFPYNPSKQYIEHNNYDISNDENDVYDMIRQSFIDLKLDENNIGKAEWNPFCDIVRPGNVVVLKPNLVINAKTSEAQEYTTTHASVIRPIVDYVWKALKGAGTIILGDAPAAETNFDKVLEQGNYKKLVNYLVKKGINIKLADFRSVKVNEVNGIWVGEQKTNIIERGIKINLGKESFFYGERKKYHGAGYDIKQTNKHHFNETHEYYVSETIIKADVIISIPKFKTHRKAGITCCLKNLVGINVDKNYLPHFTMGCANDGGDEMPTINQNRVLLLKIYNIFREYVLAYTWKYIGMFGEKVIRYVRNNKTSNNLNQNDNSELDSAGWLHNKITGIDISGGAWQGNNTICNMILDLNKIFLRCKRNGILSKNTDRKYFYVVDGIEIGEGDGPITPRKYQANFVVSGYDGLSIDLCIIEMFGISHDIIPLYKKAKLSDIFDYSNNCLVNGEKYNGLRLYKHDLIAPKGWSFYE